MSTIKISQLIELHNLGANTSATEFLAIDSANNITGRLTATTLSNYLYANNSLNVGNNASLLPNMVGQFAGTSDNYVQLNLVNNSGNGSADYIITADTGTDSTNYLDIGLNGSTYNYPGYTSAGKLDGYLMVQGNGTNPGGNLVVGTFTENRDLIVSLGSTGEDGHFATFKYNTGLHLLKKPIIFADGSSQNTSAATLAYSQAGFAKANTVDTANTWLQANDATTLASAKLYADANGGSALAAAKVYTDTANTFLRANDTTTLNSAKAYADGLNAAQLNTAFAYTDSAYSKANTALDFANAAFSKANTTATNLIITNSLASGAYTLADAANTIASGAYIKANNALANTSGVFNGNLIVTGNTTAQSVNTGNLVVVGTANVSGTLNVIGVISGNAQIVLQNTNFLSTESAVTISASPTVSTPVNDGYMLHISGKNGVPSRIITDSYGTGAYSVYSSRTARGTVSSPSAVQSGDIIGRFSASGYGTTKFQQYGTGRIDFLAAENYTDANTASQIKFWNCSIGSNTLTNILTLNGDSADFTGVVKPQKGFIYTPRLPVGNQTTITIDYATDSMIKANLVADLTVSHTNFTQGKVVEMWLVNTGGTNRTVTHGISALNSTTNSTTFTIPATSSAYMRFFSIGGDLANTFVSVVHA